VALAPGFAGVQTSPALLEADRAGRLAARLVARLAARAAGSDAPEPPAALLAEFDQSAREAERALRWAAPDLPGTDLPAGVERGLLLVSEARGKVAAARGATVGGGAPQPAAPGLYLRRLGYPTSFRIDEPAPGQPIRLEVTRRAEGEATR
jgi:hypothetical protein